MKMNCKTGIRIIVFATYLFGNQIEFGILEMKLSSFQLAISKIRHAIKIKAAKLDVEKTPSALIRGKTTLDPMPPLGRMLDFQTVKSELFPK